MSTVGPTDRAFDPAQLRGRRRGVALRTGLVVAVPLLAVALGLSQFAPRVDRDRLVLATVDRGVVEGGFQAAGRLVPRGERLISAPIGARVVAVAVEPGDAVEVGMPLLELDLADQQLELARLDQRLAALDGQADRRRRELVRDGDDLADRLAGAGLDFELAEARRLRAERLHEAGLDPAERLREAEVESERARLAVASAERSLSTHRSNADTEFASLATERGLVAREAAATADLLARSQMRGEEPGVVVEVAVEPGATVAKGAVLLRVADLGAYQVEASAPASVAPRLAVGLPVRVALDAGSTLDGRVETVRPAVDAGSVRFVVALDQASHPDLRPNRRVDAWVILERRQDAVRVSARGLAAAGRRVPMWVVEGDRAVRREVELGLSGPDHLEVLSGLLPGDRLVVAGIAPDSPATLRLDSED